MVSEKKKPRILVTAGEPAGVGPDIIIKLSQINHNYDLTIIGDPDLLRERAKYLSTPVDILTVTNRSIPQDHLDNDSLKVIPVTLITPAVPGTLDVRNANYVLEILDIASRECLSKNYDAVVTAPIQKSVINDAGISFSGHTEYLAEQCGGSFPVMLLACPELRVALVTTHLPLRDVADAITTERVETVIRIVINEMNYRFGIKNPCITVCGLNPHAGENGHLGTEEITSISPVIESFVKSGHSVSGPLSADTAFRHEQRQKTDVFICMYHDQGLPVLKSLGFGEAVNITLGLPIIRTSVDHGTALELAGTGKAQCDSLLAAIDMADELVRHQSNSLKTYPHKPSITVDEI